MEGELDLAILKEYGKIRAQFTEFRLFKVALNKPNRLTLDVRDIRENLRRNLPIETKDGNRSLVL